MYYACTTANGSLQNYKDYICDWRVERSVNFQLTFAASTYNQLPVSVRKSQSSSPSRNFTCDCSSHSSRLLCHPSLLRSFTPGENIFLINLSHHKLPTPIKRNDFADLLTIFRISYSRSVFRFIYFYRAPQSAAFISWASVIDE